VLHAMLVAVAWYGVLLSLNLMFWAHCNKYLVGPASLEPGKMSPGGRPFEFAAFFFLNAHTVSLRLSRLSYVSLIPCAGCHLDCWLGAAVLVHDVQ
jgi:hypothetical protein